jgi:AP-1 complex subunit mu
MPICQSIFQSPIYAVVALAKKNPNVAMVLSFLYKCVETFVCYFKDLEEESVRDNFVVIYELLDEMLDFG